MKQGGLEAETGTEVYFHYPQTAAGVGFAPRTVNLVTRSPLSPEALGPAVREATHALDPALPVDGFRSMEAVLSDSVAGPRFLALLLVVFAALAVALAAVGAGSVVAALAAERTSELGLRMALGATRGDLMRLVLGQGMRLAALGLAVGAAAAWAAGRLLQSLLFGVSATDAVSFAAAFGIVLAAAGLACVLPARRAAGLQPTEALRHG